MECHLDILKCGCYFTLTPVSASNCSYYSATLLCAVGVDDPFLYSIGLGVVIVLGGLLLTSILDKVRMFGVSPIS